MQLESLCSEEDARYKSIHTVGFHLPDNANKSAVTKSDKVTPTTEKKEQITSCPELNRETGSLWEVVEMFRI